MTLFELHADMEQLAFQMKRIADILERLIPPAVIHTPAETKAELHQVQPRSRWEAEKEDRRWRSVSDEVAAVTPRR